MYVIVLSSIIVCLILCTGTTLLLFSASAIPAVCLIGVCLSGCNTQAVVGLMIVVTVCYGTVFAGIF